MMAPKAFKRMEAGLKEVLAIARGEKKPARVAKPFNKWDYLKTKADMKAYIEESDEDAAKVTRFEVIDETGRAYTRYGVAVMLSFQDEGRTLKAFIKSRGLIPNRKTIAAMKEGLAGRTRKRFKTVKALLADLNAPARKAKRGGKKK